MSHDSLLPLSPDEALYAFMDGELEVSQEQTLFNELAASPELRTELKDVLTIRRAVLHDLTAPPADAETGLLGAIGFQGAGAGAAGVLAATSASQGAVGSMATAGVSSMMSSILTAASVLLAGTAVAWWLLAFSAADTSHAIAGRTTVTGSVQHGISGEPSLQTTIIAPTDTVRSVRYVKVYQPAPSNPQPVSNVAPTNVVTNSIGNTEHDLASVDEIVAATSSLAQIESAQLHSLPFTHIANNDQIPQKASFLSMKADPAQVFVRIRTLASGLRSSEQVPMSVSQAVLPNTAAALVFPINTVHHVGVELGTESFRQEFTSMADGRQLTVLQTPVLFWLGGTYEFSGKEFTTINGLTPFAITTLGYAYSQGPIGRATVGLAYQAAGPFRFTVGLDASMLGYQHQSNWFTASKWGMSYGVSINLGALR